MNEDWEVHLDLEEITALGSLVPRYAWVWLRFWQNKEHYPICLSARRLMFVWFTSTFLSLIWQLYLSGWQGEPRKTRSSWTNGYWGTRSTSEFTKLSETTEIYIHHISVSLNLLSICALEISFSILGPESFIFEFDRSFWTFCCVSVKQWKS